MLLHLNHALMLGILPPALYMVAGPRRHHAYHLRSFHLDPRKRVAMTFCSLSSEISHWTLSRSQHRCAIQAQNCNHLRATPETVRVIQALWTLRS